MRRYGPGCWVADPVYPTGGWGEGATPGQAFADMRETERDLAELVEKLRRRRESGPGRPLSG